MVGGEDEEVFRPETREKACKVGVERLQAAGEALGVAPVTVLHVEILEVGEDEPRPFVQGGEEGFAVLGVALGPGSGQEAATAEKLRHDADAAHASDLVQEVGRRLQGPILTPLGADPRAGFADERASDDALDVGEFPPDAAPFVQGLDGNDILMGGDLEHRIGAGVEDGLAGAEAVLPSSSRMAVPLAARLPSTSRPMRRSNSATRSKGKPSG